MVFIVEMLDHCNIFPVMLFLGTILAFSQPPLFMKSLYMGVWARLAMYAYANIYIERMYHVDCTSST